MYNQLEIAEFNKIIQQIGSLSNASEAHGMLCGLLLLKTTRTKEIWYSQLISDYQPSERIDLNVEFAINRIYDFAQSQFKSDDFVFEMLLPADDTPLEERTDALASWCQGFLFGIGLTGFMDELKKTDTEQHLEILDYLKDLYEISKAVVSSEEGEDDEQFFCDLTEYVRIGVMLIWEYKNSHQEQPRKIH